MILYNFSPSASRWTESKIPISANWHIVAVPPYETNGRPIPVLGKKLTFFVPRILFHITFYLISCVSVVLNMLLAEKKGVGHMEMSYLTNMCILLLRK